MPSGLRVTGIIKRITEKPWTMDGRSGIATTCRVLTTDADFVDVRMPTDATARGSMRRPEQDQSVDWVVSVNITDGKGLRITAEGPWIDHNGTSGDLSAGGPSSSSGSKGPARPVAVAG